MGSLAHPTTAPPAGAGGQAGARPGWGDVYISGPQKIPAGIPKLLPVPASSPEQGPIRAEPQEAAPASKRLVFKTELPDTPVGTCGSSLPRQRQPGNHGKFSDCNSRTGCALARIGVGNRQCHRPQKKTRAWRLTRSAPLGAAPCRRRCFGLPSNAPPLRLVLFPVALQASVVPGIYIKVYLPC